jgi:hypothetical protein
LYHFLPTYRDWFVEEDQFLENLTTGLFLLAFLLSVLILIFTQRRRIIDFTVPAASLLGFLEEISYGERYSQSIPMINSQKDIDAFHDYFKIGYLFIQKQENDSLAYIIAGASFLLILFSGYILVRYYQKQGYKKPTIIFGPLIFTLISASFILIALILDLNVLEIRNFTFIEELLEFLTALSLFFGAISIYKRIIFENQRGIGNRNQINQAPK